MHKYMRAIGFSEYTDRKKLKELLTDVIMNSDHRAYTMNQEGILLGEFSKNHTHTKGTIESGTFGCLLYTSPSPRDRTRSRMPSSA